MRTKLFLAFIFIIFLALLSNIVFERLIIADFNDFISGTEEDHIYWIMASVEGTFNGGQWDRHALSKTLHWGLMLGLESYVEGSDGKTVLSSSDTFADMSPSMFGRMDSLLKLTSGVGEYTWYPLYVKGDEIGRIYVRPIERRGMLPLREEIFRKRGREFLIISFFIAGGGALILSLLFTSYLSKPIRMLTGSAEKIAKGDFSVHSPQVHKKYKDEIDRLAVTFNYMAEALKREDALRKHLTSNIAHELRTPLTIIKANLEAMEDGIITDTESAIKTVRMEVKRLISLVEGIEDITRAEASFFKKGPREEIDLKTFIESILSGMNKIVEEKGLYLKADGPSLIAETYPEKLHIILKNLVTNAHKFTSAGGITVRWGSIPGGQGEGFYISVEDTGQGIGEYELSRIFDRFYKSDISDGKGLGLAIVKELADVIGGKVEVESAIMKGTRFTITFD